MANSKKAKELCERWNKLHPVGTPVTVTRDLGEKLDTVTRSEAWVLPCHIAVIEVVGISGGYALTRVSARKQTTMILTPAHKHAMAAVKDGADVFFYEIARLLREVEKHHPELIVIGPATSDIPGDQQQPYFAACLTAAGCEAIKEAA